MLSCSYPCLVIVKYWTSIALIASFILTWSQQWLLYQNFSLVWAGLVLCQGYDPDKRRANWTQNSHFKQCISWGVWQFHPIQCMTIPLVNVQSYRVQVYCICSIYTFIYTINTFLYNIFTYFWCSENMRLTSIVFGMVHSDRTVVVLLHKQFSSWIISFFNSISIVLNCTYTTMNDSNMMT